MTWKYSAFLGLDRSISILGRLWVCWVTSILHISSKTSQCESYPRMLCIWALYKHHGSSASSTLQQIPGKRYAWHSSLSSVLLSPGSTWPQCAAATPGKACILKSCLQSIPKGSTGQVGCKWSWRVWWDSSTMMYTTLYFMPHFPFWKSYLVNYKRELRMNNGILTMDDWSW